jgi:hypothetical protein
VQIAARAHTGLAISYGTTARVTVQKQTDAVEEIDRSDIPLPDLNKKRQEKKAEKYILEAMHDDKKHPVMPGSTEGSATLRTPMEISPE